MTTFGRLALGLAVMLTASAVTQAADLKPFTIDDLVRIKRVSEPVISPDGKTVVFTLRETDMDANRGRTDLWALELNDKNATPRRLTTHPEADSSPQWSSDSRWVYFLSGRSGTSQVWRLQVAGGEAEAVTQLPLDVGSFKLAPNGALLALTLEVFPDCTELACTVERMQAREKSKATGAVHDRIFIRHWDTWADGRTSQLFIADLAAGRMTGKPRSLSATLDADVPSKPFGDASEYTFAPDSKKVLFSTRMKDKSEPWSTNFDIYEVAVSGGELRNLTTDNPAWDTQPVFSADGRWLAWRSMKRPGFEADRFHVVVMDVKTGQRRALTDYWDRSVDWLAFSSDARLLYVTTDHLGQHPLWSIDIKSGKLSMLTGPGHVDGVSVGERELVFTSASLKSPNELYAMNPRNGALRDLPRINGQALSERALGEPEQFSFAGAEGQTVYAHVVKPANMIAGRKYPVAFIVHGGPQSSYANQWSYRWNPQTYAGAGYAAVFVDFHGSPGYGQAFTDSISGDWGGKPLQDLQLGLSAALNRYPWLDASRTCALGASYGGFMINWMAGNWSEPFKCLVNHDGIFDNRGMAYTTEELWFEEWEHGGPQFQVPANYEKFNPVNHVTKWNKPMLVIHGQLDYRVPDNQGIATFTALQRRGIPSRLLFFPNENHWVLKPANSVQWHNEVLQWLGQWTGSSTQQTE